MDMSLPEVDIEANVKAFFENPLGNYCLPDERNASFDYCYNYFQGFRKRGEISEIASPQNLELSCLQIGFYLASWGMFRGKSFLLQKSVRHYSPLLQLVADTPRDLWAIDADQYGDGQYIDMLIEYEEKIRQKISEGVTEDRKASAILTTKVMLGIFGNIPAFDSYFGKGFQVSYPNKKALEKVSRYYQANKAKIDEQKIHTIDFSSGEKTSRRYPKAKIIDMVFFAEGAKIFEAEAAEEERKKLQAKT